MIKPMEECPVNQNASKQADVEACCDSCGPQKRLGKGLTTREMRIEDERRECDEVRKNELRSV